MSHARMPRIALLLALFCVAATSARALQLGETKAQLLAQHGPPGAEDHGRNLAMYFWEGWSAQVEFQGDAVGKLTYRRNWYLQEAEINSLLQSNGGVTHWRETSAPDAPNRQWARDDGAFATCARTRPLSIAFESALVFADSPVAPKVVAPATPNPAFARVTTFPRPLDAVPEPDLPVADPPTPAPVPAAAPHSLPKLPAEEIDPAAPQNSASELPIAAQPAPGAPEAPVQPVNEPEPAPERHPVAAAPTTHGLAYTLGSLVLLTLVGTGFYFFKRHRELAGARPPIASISAVAPDLLGSLPGLDTLRADQFELLVAELLRREGYTVELSAALSSDDGVDLTLRRDSETILVQCKHWKTAQVGEGELREFYRAMAASGAPRGIFVTLGEFTAEARQFAGGEGIELLDGAAVGKNIATLARPGEDLCHLPEWLEEFVAHARIFDPDCPVCQGTMLIRHNRASGAPSWSCRSYPRCPGRREPRLDLLPAPAAR